MSNFPQTSARSWKIKNKDKETAEETLIALYNENPDFSHQQLASELYRVCRQFIYTEKQVTNKLAELRKNGKIAPQRAPLSSSTPEQVALKDNIAALLNLIRTSPEKGPKDLGAIKEKILLQGLQQYAAVHNNQGPIIANPVIPSSTSISDSSRLSKESAANSENDDRLYHDALDELDVLDTTPSYRREPTFHQPASQSSSLDHPISPCKQDRLHSMEYEAPEAKKFKSGVNINTKSLARGRHPSGLVWSVDGDLLFLFITPPSYYQVYLDYSVASDTVKLIFEPPIIARHNFQDGVSQRAQKNFEAGSVCCPISDSSWTEILIRLPCNIADFHVPSKSVEQGSYTFVIKLSQNVLPVGDKLDLYGADSRRV